MTNGSWLHFDVHGRMGMRVTRSAPTASQLRDMFAPFSAQELSHSALTVVARPEPLTSPAHAEDFIYTDRAVHLLGPDVRIEQDGTGYRVAGTRELLTTLLPLVDRLMVCAGAAMIHAATVRYRGHGIALPAAGGVGKTSTIAKLLRKSDIAFMGDDWAFLARDGTLLGYEKPLFIKPHHRPIYPHLFRRKRKPLVPSRLSRPLARLTTLVHPYITRYPRLARASRHWSPEHMMVPPRRAFPDAQFAASAPLRAAIFVERHDGATLFRAERDTDWMTARMMGNFHAEMPRESREVLTALAGSGLLPLERVMADKSEVVRQGLASSRSYLLQVPRAWSPDRASDAIVDELTDIARSLGL